MFERIKRLFAGRQPTANTAPQPMFHRFYRYPDLFTFNMAILDFRLLVRPQTGDQADRDTLLLLLFAYQEIFKSPTANEAFIRRKFAEVSEGSAPLASSFAAALAAADTALATQVIDAALAEGDVERVIEAQGESLSLTAQGLERAHALADKMQRAMAGSSEAFES